MSLPSCTVTAKIAWQLAKSNTPFAQTLQGADSRSLNYAVPAGATSVYVARLSLAASASSDVALNSFTDLAGNAVTATKIYGLIVLPDLLAVDAAGVCTVKPSVSNGLSGWVFPAAGTAIPAQGGLLFAQPSPFVLSGSVNSLNFQNTGTGTLTVDLVAIVGA